VNSRFELIWGGAMRLPNRFKAETALLKKATKEQKIKNAAITICY
jgi:hypothetical protein